MPGTGSSLQYLFLFLSSHCRWRVAQMGNLFLGIITAYLFPPSQPSRDADEICLVFAYTATRWGFFFVHCSPVCLLRTRTLIDWLA
ncbi:hypothetical protein BU24DRAFT_118411 [Aaosphaeria arxii CBS 175.79]|uniref:Uncharacterized protein n=1 Tax=Aaosphaeria arxii CBS 175.79 TaxID=1450172 RepID=A0A6A5Y299_9PLEO|nr:uncharacterized protein BU24DRAFT_118411 [Aaosphaeria arxii CBS 175.79]KAF2019369.1 hypothetical protein BU24DRAFT_118411 [Aaosphaeria arxii CBS 175.79]